MDMTEGGRKIGEKLCPFLDAEQRKELVQCILEKAGVDISFVVPNSLSNEIKRDLTEIRVDSLYFCLEQRFVGVCGKEIKLTAKEFDLLALLICNPGRVFTFEMIMDLVWNEEDSFYSRKVIINHASNLRKKLRISDAVPDYIKSIRGIGYKFDSDCRGTT